MPVETAAGGPRVRITRVPAGEAPLWVREKWVGLELPIALKSGDPVNVRVRGVLSGPRHPLALLLALLMGRVQRTRGYVVNAAVAVDILEMSSPEAAMWWHANAAHMLQPGRFFVFQEAAGEIVGEVRLH